jgi:ParB/Sulfiredoxin domain
MVRAGGLEPPQAFRPYGFSYQLRLSPLAPRRSFAHGLLQPLVVKKAPRGKHAVVAGQRRYLALKRLHDDGKLSGNYAVACRIIADDADATEISLGKVLVYATPHIPLCPRSASEAGKRYAPRKSY